MTKWAYAATSELAANGSARANQTTHHRVHGSNIPTRKVTSGKKLCQYMARHEKPRIKSHLPLAMQMSSESKLLLVSVHGTALSSGRRIPTGVYEECQMKGRVINSTSSLLFWSWKLM